MQFLSRNLKFIIVGVALVGLLFVFKFRSGEPEAQASVARTERVTNVVVYLLQPDTLVQYSRLPVTVLAWREVNLSFQEGGVIRSVFAELGDTVQAGATLARLDMDLLKAELVEAEAGAKLQKYNYERAQDLFKEGAIPEQDFYAAEYNLKRAESTLLTLKKRMENAVLRAPFAGEVAADEVDEGEHVQVGSPAFRLVQTTRMKLEAWVPENQIADFSKGNAVEVTFDALPDQVFAGTVGRIGPAADPVQRVFPLEVHLGNSDGMVRAGMMGRLKAVRRTFREVVVISREAVVERETGPAAFVVQDRVVHLRSLRLGASEGDQVRVLAGLDFGDQVVVRGGRDLIDGDHVDIREVVER